MTENPWLEDTDMTSRSVTLTPMLSSHRNELVRAASDGELWNLWFTSVPGEKSIDDYIGFALSEKAAGRALPFVVRENDTGDIIGSTRFCNIENVHRRAEIGYTWYAKRSQRTSVNSECKLSMLSYAFESRGAIAIEFRTHASNTPSRNAILRLGAKHDGILRQHMLLADGSFRDTYVYSILNSEWPAVKKSLEDKLRKWD